MLEVIVFICGAVVMILEMVGSRVLAPYLGTSIVVWTSLIGVILGSLSIGYWWGGRIADNKPSYRILSLIVLLAAVFVAAVAVSKSFLLGSLRQYSSSLPLGSTTAAMILFAPPSILLGMISPYAVRLKIIDVKKSGSTVGGLYAISTVGSIFGTFFAGFFLIGFLGSTSILVALSIILAATSLLASMQERKIKAASLCVFILLLFASKAYDAHLASIGVHDVDTDYNRVLVYHATDPASARMTRVMVTNPHGKQSAMFVDNPSELAVQYTKFYQLAAHFKPGMKKILMLGGGGYSFPKFALRHYPDVTMEVVEIDPGITDLSRRFFALEDDPRLTVRHEDARTFLNRATGKYDVILGDTFNSHYSIPFHLSTVEAVRRLHALLEEDGIVIANILSAIEGDRGRFLRAEYATFKAVFPQVFLIPVYSSRDGESWQNVMLIALKSSTEPAFQSGDPVLNAMLDRKWRKEIPADVPVLTDDFAPVDRYVALQ